MNPESRRRACVLCVDRNETQVTGALSTKEHVAAHQNCLVTVNDTPPLPYPPIQISLSYGRSDVFALRRALAEWVCSWGLVIDGFVIRSRGDTGSPVRVSSLIRQELLPPERRAKWCRTVAVIVWEVGGIDQLLHVHPL